MFLRLAVGVANRTKINDHQMSASSFRCQTLSIYGRLNFDAGCLVSWCSSINQWLQVDMSNIYLVVSVATQGGSRRLKQYVKTYYLAYSEDGSSWQDYKEKGLRKVKKSNLLCCFSLFGLHCTFSVWFRNWLLYLCPRAEKNCKGN